MKKILLLWMCLFLAVTAQAEIITVDDDGPADFNNIQAAINYSNDSDIIIVLPGTYTGEGNHDIDFLGKAVSVRSVAPDDPYIVAATIIDCNGPPAGHRRAFWFQSGEDANSVVDGITITNAYSAAVYCSESGPTIRNCIIKSGFASGIFGPSGSPTVDNCTIVDRYWFGISLYGGGSPTITNCLISGNGAGGINYDGGGSAKVANCIITDNTGAGIYCGIEQGEAATIEITDCNISGNGGSGVCCGDHTTGLISLSIADCTIIGNSAGSGYYCGGGIRCASPINITITDSIISGNEAYDDGGGIYCGDTSGGPISLTLTNSTLSENWAGYYGGGIYCGFNVYWTITNSTIAGNTAMYNNGGGIYSAEHMISHTITNCTISGNVAGGGLWAYELFHYELAPAVTNCIISGNSAGSEGAGLYGSYILTNCTVTGNFAEDAAGGLAGGCTAIRNCIIRENPTDQIIYSMLEPVITYSNVQGGCEGLGNIDADPCFVEPGKWVDVNDPNIIVEPNDPNAVWVDGDYHLKSQGWYWNTKRNLWHWYEDETSRCIDAGNPGSPLGEELLTVPSDPNNDWGENLRINMGAYGGTPEASMPPYDWALLADLTNDGIVNFADFTHQADDWRGTESEQPGDLDRNALIDFADVLLLAEDWLKKTTWHE